MTVKVTGVKELVRGLGKVSPALRREIRPALRGVGQTVLNDMRRRASYSSRIPGATRMTVRFSAKGGGVFFRTDHTKAPEARVLELGNLNGRADTFRHPVFGTDTWVTQPTRPYFFPALKAGQRDLRRGIGVAVAASLREAKRP